MALCKKYILEDYGRRMTSVTNINLVGNKPVTKKQMDTVIFIRSFSRKYKRTPNYGEIARHFGIAVVSAYERMLRIKRNMIGFCESCGKKL